MAPQINYLKSACSHLCCMKRQTFQFNNSHVLSHFLFLTRKIREFPPYHPLSDCSSEQDLTHHHKPALTRDKEIPSDGSNPCVGHILKEPLPKHVWADKGMRKNFNTLLVMLLWWVRYFQASQEPNVCR